MHKSTCHLDLALGRSWSCRLILRAVSSVFSAVPRHDGLLGVPVRQKRCTCGEAVCGSAKMGERTRTEGVRSRNVKMRIYTRETPSSLSTCASIKDKRRTEHIDPPVKDPLISISTPLSRHPSLQIPCGLLTDIFPPFIPR